MKLSEYLRSIMSEEDAGYLEEALEMGRPIIISGTERTSKTTLARALRARGYNVLEDVEPLRIHLTKQIPVEKCIPNFYQSIE